MTYPECRELLLETGGGLLTITINRPHKRNAMNGAVVEELMAVFSYIENDRSVRAVVLQGAEGNFCSGGDISSMKMDADDNPGEAALKFNRSFGHMITKINQAPQVVITLLEGAVLGGGLGLACISDIAIADVGVKIGMPETGLGIIPAQIAPFVVSRIGLPQARRLALLGAWVDGAEACNLGIAHYLTDGEAEMQEQLAQVLAQVKRTAPGANAATKALMQAVAGSELEQLLDEAAISFAASLASPEGQEGTQAFRDKRKPTWAQKL
ncbi:MAG: enoyl-CoA hydratase/isomerase family protein [Kordiimonadaceae bacterium]|nr:enoyl-CoA hydratase/isomerase family protein [Kordiimonadaceae bacterium]